MTEKLPPSLCPPTPSGPGDDAALFRDHEAITVDALVEGVHWDDRLSPADVGYKAVAVSVSDLGAMGATPSWMVLTLALPAPLDDVWLDGFRAGFAEAAVRYAVALIGGDTTRSPGARFVSVTMGGICPTPVLRSTARPGDHVWVTGYPGLAGAGYRLPTPPPEALQALRRPTPPLELARALVPHVHAMMDLSDGLATDLPRMADASGIGALVDPSLLPLHPCMASLHDPLHLQVGAGDDYQLLFTAPPIAEAPIRAAADRYGVPLARIGTTTVERSVKLLGRPWPETWSHFPPEETT